MKCLRYLQLLGAALLLLFVTAAPAAAMQEGGHGNTKTWLELFETTGPVGYLMLGCSIAGT